ncbi:hypothetical protein UAM5_00063 [Ralstonia phage UAM5]|nr:hypothetical protein UAM5_00063 [Ralstonia phage UAM5]
MKYYPHHIGDFDKKTRHLTRLERSVYRDMLDMYYDTEQPLPLDIDVLCRRIIARSDDERTAVQQVLNEFFTETEHGWSNDRCDSEIEAYRRNVEQKSAAGKASAQKRATKNQQPFNGRSSDDAPDVGTDDERTNNGEATNQEPRTRNQEPRTKNKKSAPRGAAFDAVGALVGEGVSPQAAGDFAKMRKAKGAELTQTALDGIRREVEKAGCTMAEAIDTCCARGWRGFKAEWLREYGGTPAPRANGRPSINDFGDDAPGAGQYDDIFERKGAMVTT